MKILLVAVTFGIAGGTGKYILDLIEHLSAKGYDISLLYVRSSGEENTKAKSLRLLREIYHFPDLGAYPGRNTDKSEREIERAIQGINPDMIYMQGILNYGLIDLFLRMRPTIAMEHDEGLFCLRDSKAFFFSREICKRKLGIGCLLRGCFLRKPSRRELMPKWNSLYHARRRLNIYKKISRILVPSNYMKEQFLKNGFAEKKVFVIPHYTYIPDKSEISYAENENKILFIGRIDRYKGLDFLIKAILIMHTDVKLVVAGEGSWLRKARRLVRRLGILDKVEFKGWVNEEGVKELYRETSVLAVPSISGEAFGYVGIEAMAYARPVVAYDVGGISDWLKDGETGFLVAPKDIKGLAHAIEKLLKDKRLAASMGKTGREQVVKNFNRDKNLIELIKHFNGVISAGK